MADFFNSSVRMIEIEQDCKFGFTADMMRAVINDWSVVGSYCGILHDRDMKEDCVTPRDPHCHLLIKFKTPCPVSAILARAVKVGMPEDCITENRLQRVKSWSGAVNYLTHRDEQLPHKHVYDVSDLFTNIDFEIEAGAAHSKKVMSISPAREKEIIDNIVSGVISEYNLNDFISAYERINLERKISCAFKIRSEMLESEDRNMEVVFIEGGSGVGKDSFAVNWCKTRNLAYFRTNNNQKFPFDDYKGQPVIIWSDARDDVFKPSELFNLLDNFYQSKQKARFHDRLLNCQYILITSIKPLSDWYKAAFDDAGEPRKQLFRRIKTNIRMDMEYCNIYLYDEEKASYVPMGKLPNVYNHFEERLKTDEQKKAFVSDLFGCMGELCSNVADAINNDQFKPVDNTDEYLQGQLTVDDWMSASDFPFK